MTKLPCVVTLQLNNHLNEMDKHDDEHYAREDRKQDFILDVLQNPKEFMDALEVETCGEDDYKFYQSLIEVVTSVRDKELLEVAKELAVILDEALEKYAEKEVE